MVRNNVHTSENRENHRKNRRLSRIIVAISRPDRICSIERLRTIPLFFPLPIVSCILAGFIRKQPDCSYFDLPGVQINCGRNANVLRDRRNGAKSGKLRQEWLASSRKSWTTNSKQFNATKCHSVIARGWKLGLEPVGSKSNEADTHQDFLSLSPRV